MISLFNKSRYVVKSIQIDLELMVAGSDPGCALFANGGTLKRRGTDTCYLPPRFRWAVCASSLRLHHQKATQDLRSLPMSRISVWTLLLVLLFDDPAHLPGAG